MSRRKSKIVLSSIVVLLLFNYNALIFSQSSDFRIPDSIASENSSREFYSVAKLTKALTNNLDDELMKYRAIFRWITLNISYDIEATESHPAQVLRVGKAVCKGYANLLCEMCKLAGIECFFISGWIKTQIKDIGRRPKELHAWNAVKIKGKWNLSDVTWASSKKRNDSIETEFDEDYFIMTPEKFSLQHFPADRKWLLTDINRREFINQPVYYPYYFDISNKIQIKGNNVGILRQNYLQILVSADSTISVDEFSIEIRSKSTSSRPPQIQLENNLHYCLSFDLEDISNNSKIILKYGPKHVIGFRR